MKHKPSRCQRSSSSGFTLIEVLITVVILSIGLLGMAGIQLQGLRGTTSSTTRSQATILANDIAERIRMNLGGLQINGNPLNGDYGNVSITRNANGNASIACSQAAAPTFCSAVPGSTADVVSCSTSQMAQFDIYEFACGLGHNGGVINTLPSGTASITCETAACLPGSEVTINIGWSETSDENGVPQLKNISMVIIP